MIIKNKTILILGGTGSLGNHLTSEYINNNKIVIYSRSEIPQWTMRQKFQDNISFFIGDIRDKIRLESCIFQHKPNIIIIAAALKHIDFAEKNISESIDTNVNGVKNIIDIIYHNYSINTIPFLESVLFISTDKACSPINVYGICKALSERIMIEKSEYLTTNNCPKLLVVRYGNVISSNGSLIPLFKNIAKDNTKKEFTITDENMTRYFMSLKESCNLIDYALLYGNSGETIVPKKINAYKVIDIANFFSKKYDKPIKNIGIRVGEKLHESLISQTESIRTIERDGYYIILPTFTPINNLKRVLFEEFNSSKTIDLDVKIINLD
jgi:UDP-N-acetylglucosamine 4,6-dehydratase